MSAFRRSPFVVSAFGGLKGEMMPKILKALVLSLGAVALTSAVALAQTTPPPAPDAGQATTPNHSTRKSGSKKTGHHKRGKKKSAKKPAQ